MGTEQKAEVKAEQTEVKDQAAQQKPEVLVTKDMTIGAVVQHFPEVADVLESFGLHCVGCHVNQMESIEQGALGHGMDPLTIEKMIDQANKVAVECQIDTPDPNAASTETKEGNIAITDNAFKKMGELMKQKNLDGNFFRVEVVPGGCSGFSYNFRIEKESQGQDKIMEKDSVKVIIDPKTLQMISGATIDYIETLSSSGFKISNPQASSSCGCGKSFS